MTAPDETTADETTAEHWWVDVRRLRIDLCAADVHAALYADDAHSFWLDSNSDDERSKISVLGTVDGVHAHVLSYRAGEPDTSRIAADGSRERVNGDLLHVAQTQLTRFAVRAPQPAAGGFCLGYVGYLGYGLKANTCGVADLTPSDVPDGRLTFVERAIVFDHVTGDVQLLALRSNGGDTRLDAASRLWIRRTARTLMELAASPHASSGSHSQTHQKPGLSSARSRQAVLAQPQTLPDDATLRATFAFRHDEAGYIERVQASQRHIAAGDSYEVCLTNMGEYAASVDPVSTYRRLRELSRVPYGALLRCGDFSVLSASPECFLTVDENRTVETRPIKGTSPRGATPRQDAQRRDELWRSEKERAENLMIVDLMRNDLSRVCRPETVRVPRLFTVESFPGAHQLISTVRAELRDDCTAIDCIRATFPAGSMTGAPKRRTMQIIDELEGGPRGVYAGALGWLSLNGTLSLSVVIRTIIVEPHRATFGVGGAITQLSQPEAEYAETLVKARVVGAALLHPVLSDPAESPRPRRRSS
ncbi:aminodeoxychorismate synthase component I [Pseudoclavibacter sp. 13-3]|uniref:aminodeoxychorismate synthase component I n=1 Tax=Pseudoclavibacter sp. 13-3 TaxID=2901228 RepID=UPI001E346410|nr:aminodeoxychorismate synthase component I [Pseudoclavibacter sp. 13-3]MCD7100784.1 aminodeoxychorismate synthase component I [Pseudoclavibacter sp. 13-3]